MKRLLAAGALLLLGAFGAQAQVVPQQQCVSTALAGGTADAITVPLLPCQATTTLLILTLSATNATTTPTLQQIASPQLPAQVIVNSNGSALKAGDLTSGNVVLLTNNGTNWIVLSRGTIEKCTDLTDSGTACQANTGTSGHNLPFLDGSSTFSGNNGHSGTESFAPVIGAIGNGGSPVNASTYTFGAGDCGKTVVFTFAGAVTATIPASIVPAATVCSFAVLATQAFKVSVNGSAVSPATLISESGFTGTSGAAGSMIGLTLLTVGVATDAFLTGSGS